MARYRFSYLVYFIVLSAYTYASDDTGDIYITYNSMTSKKGLRIVYRPKPGPKTYSTAYIGFYELNSDYGRDAYDEKISSTKYSGWKTMIRNQVGDTALYYFSDPDSEIKVTAGKWFGYAVHMLHWRSKDTTFNDDYNFYQVPASVTYCSIYSFEYSLLTCEDALDGKPPRTTTTRWTPPANNWWEKDDDEDKNNKTGAIVAATFAGIVVVATVIAVLKLFCCCSLPPEVENEENLNAQAVRYNANNVPPVTAGTQESAPRCTCQNPTAEIRKSEDLPPPYESVAQCSIVTSSPRDNKSMNT